MRIERHDIDHTWCSIPMNTAEKDTHRDYSNPAHYTKRPKGGYTQTTRQRMQEAADTGQPLFVRRDVLLWNDPPTACPHCGTEGTEFGKQHTVCLAPHGQLTGPLDLVSRADRDWAYDESRKCWELAQQEPLFMRFYYPGATTTTPSER